VFIGTGLKGLALQVDDDDDDDDIFIL